MFGDDEGVRCEERAVGIAAEEAERLGVGFFLEVGWIEVDGVQGRRGFAQALEQRHDPSVFQRVTPGYLQICQVGPEGFEGWPGIFGEEDVRGSSADGFEPYGAGSGEEVGEAGRRDARAENVE